jgi:tetratricopeptide (TPR) repeat protein
LYEEAVTLCRGEGDALGLAHTIRHLGDIHREAGRLADAELCYGEVLTLYRAHEPNPLDLANALRPLAILREATGQAEEARRLWEEARKLYMAVNVQAAVAECSVRLARLIR